MNRTRKGIGAAVGSIAATALLAVTVPSKADHGLPHPELLGHGTFLDDVSIALRNKILGRGTHVVHLSDASDLFVLRISIEAGGIAPWHNHEGVGFLVNLGPGVLTNFLGESCEPRLFYPGDAFVDPGYGNLHAVRNDSDQEIVILATFVATEGPPVIPENPPVECGDVL
jgi:quercetin dioxygenase-like cupin family protein